MVYKLKDTGQGFLRGGFEHTGQDVKLNNKDYKNSPDLLSYDYYLRNFPGWTKNLKEEEKFVRNLVDDPVGTINTNFVQPTVTKVSVEVNNKIIATQKEVNEKIVPASRHSVEVINSNPLADTITGGMSDGAPMLAGQLLDTFLPKEKKVIKVQVYYYGDEPFYREIGTDNYYKNNGSVDFEMDTSGDYPDQYKSEYSNPGHERQEMIKAQVASAFTTEPLKDSKPFALIEVYAGGVAVHCNDIVELHNSLDTVHPERFLNPKTVIHHNFWSLSDQQAGIEINIKNNHGIAEQNSTETEPEFGNHW